MLNALFATDQPGTRAQVWTTFTVVLIFASLKIVTAEPIFGLFAFASWVVLLLAMYRRLGTIGVSKYWMWANILPFGTLVLTCYLGVKR